MTEQREVLLDKVTDASKAPEGRDIRYKCLNCGESIPSQPDDNVGCRCGNVFIDIDYFRLVVKDYELFQPVRLLRSDKKRPRRK